ncbi:hypothetical protein C1H46_006707 [Malus baccata]|uniref:Uncharacterized protein n=1 Tax=Malus baccata TaxID=106549 RepID=A0A540N9P5_MALBA|nr:hypothetical protein C1H46_006707 [Malus baccata]
MGSTMAAALSYKAPIANLKGLKRSQWFQALHHSDMQRVMLPLRQFFMIIRPHTQSSGALLVSLATNSITANQSLSGDQTIVSAGGIFPYSGIELHRQEFNDSQAVRLSLKSLEADVKRANNLVDKYKNRARFYLLVKCRHIVKEVQDVTRDIGKSLAALSVANTDILLGISDQVNRLQNEMQRVEIEASQSQLQVFDKLKQGLDDQTLDQGFAK